MEGRIVLQIVTARNDGCVVNVRENRDGTLAVTLLSAFDKVSIVDRADKLPRAELFDWIENRRDW